MKDVMKINKILNKRELMEDDEPYPSPQIAII